MSKQTKNRLIATLLALIIVFIATYFAEEIDLLYNKIMGVTMKTYSIEEIPEYQGDNYIVINNNIPKFTDDDYKKDSFEKYSHLDRYKRSGVAFANISMDTMPIKEREPIGMIKPSGWKISKYESIEGKYLYNRCHLIGYQLTAENANEKNLITCTRQMNTIGMLPFENMVAKYVKKTHHHVLYRVSPIYQGKNLLAMGVQIEASSIEDEKIRFNVFVYNVQDGIEIDYSDGSNKLKTT